MKLHAACTRKGGLLKLHAVAQTETLQCCVASNVHFHQALVQALTNETVQQHLINPSSQAKGVEDDGLASASPARFSDFYSTEFVLLFPHRLYRCSGAATLDADTKLWGVPKSHTTPMGKKLFELLSCFVIYYYMKTVNLS